MKETRRHFTYANVMSTFGVFFALTGGSAAIAAIPDDDSVDSQTVIDDSLKSEDLMNDEAVKGADVVNDTLGSADIGTDAIADDEIATGGVGKNEIEAAAIGSGQISGNGVRVEEIASGAVGAGEIADSAVGGSEIAEPGVGSGEIENGAVDASEIRDDAIYRVTSGVTQVQDVDAARNGDYGLGEASVDCSTDDRDGELLSGSAQWTDVPDSNENETEDELFISEIRLNMNTETVTAIGGSDIGEVTPILDFLVPVPFVAEAICLEY